MSRLPHDTSPFSYPVKVGHIAVNPVEVKISADPKECAGLAKLWGVLSVESLSANLQINRWKKDGIRVRGRVNGQVTQACVVSLEPVPETINEEIDQIFVPDGSKLMRRPENENGELLIDPDGPDLPDVFVGDTIDVGTVVSEFAALSLNPYPRKEGAAFSGHIESTEAEDKKPSPFAVLKNWKKD